MFKVLALLTAPDNFAKINDALEFCSKITMEHGHYDMFCGSQRVAGCCLLSSCCRAGNVIVFAEAFFTDNK